MVVTSRVAHEAALFHHGYDDKNWLYHQLQLMQAGAAVALDTGISMHNTAPLWPPAGAAAVITPVVPHGMARVSLYFVPLMMTRLGLHVSNHGAARHM